MSGIQSSEVLTWPPNFDVTDTASHRDVSGCIQQAREYFAALRGDVECISTWSTADGTPIAFRTGKIPEAVTIEEYKESWRLAHARAFAKVALEMPA